MKNLRLIIVQRALHRFPLLNPSEKTAGYIRNGVNMNETIV